MSRNLIVTCGTSQIDERKMKIIADASRQRISTTDWRNLEGRVNGLRSETDNDIDDTYIEGLTSGSSADSQHCQTLVDFLAERWSESKIEGDIGTDHNPFGAEISTLYKMREKEDGEAQRRVFDPQRDQIVLLYSDTKSGAFCAGVLFKLLTHSDTWNIAPGRISPWRIKKLSGQPAEIKKAEANVRRYLLAARDVQSENLYVMTGGFKSIIPTLTIYALINEDQIYYLFEESRDLRQLSLPAQVVSQERQRRWIFSSKWETEGNTKRLVIEVETTSDTQPQDGLRTFI